jgi:polar amino acid transport system substrate-binding protein
MVGLVKKSKYSRLPLQIILSICMLFFTTTGSAAEIIIVADQWPPYCGKAGSTCPGCGVEIAQKVYEAAGNTFKYMNIPWTRAIIETREGNYNAIIGAYKEEAPDFVFPEEEFGVSRYAFYAKRGSLWTYTGIESLQSKKIGLIKGYSYGEELNVYFEKNSQRVQYVSGHDPLYQNIMKLLAGRFDTLIAGQNVMTYKIKEMGVVGEVINVGVTDISGNLYIAFSPRITKSVKYAEIFSEGIRNLKKSGELDQILERYGLHYWK